MAMSSVGKSETGPPPFVTFEFRAVEDRGASQAAGRATLREVAYAIVTPSKSTDRLEFVADEWIARIFAEAQADRYPPAWAEAFAEMYEDWRKSHEIPAEGFAVRHWPAIDKACCEMLLEAGLITVEQLAAAPDNLIAGIDRGEALRELARAWLQAAEDSGKAAEEIAALRTEVGALQAKVAELEALLAQATTPDKPRMRAVKA